MRMKNLAIGVALSLGVVGVATASEFCDGYKTGFTTGYKQSANSSLTPLTPLCPLKPLKQFGDPKSDFEFGYTLGFKHGMVEGSR